MTLYLQYANADGTYALKFTTYQGLNRTSNQTVNNLIRLSPLTDEISDVKELRSIAEEVNAVYVWNGAALLRYGMNKAGVTRRTKVIHPAITPDWFDEYDDSYGGKNYFPKMGTYETAQYVLRQGSPLHIFDAQINSALKYKFGVDYWLGDLIELESLTGELSTARITEHIRSHDSLGEKAYPTVVVE
jgi:hypothetical protein